MKNYLYIALLILSQTVCAQHIEYKNGKWDYSKGAAGDSAIRAYSDSLQFKAVKMQALNWLDKAEEKLDRKNLEQALSDSLDQRARNLDSLNPAEIQKVKTEIQSLKDEIKKAESVKDVDLKKMEKLSDRLDEMGIKTQKINKVSRRIAKNRKQAKKITGQPHTALDTITAVSKGKELARQAKQKKQKAEKLSDTESLKDKWKEKAEGKLPAKEKTIRKKAEKLDKDERIKKAGEARKEVRARKNQIESKVDSLEKNYSPESYRNLLEEYDPVNRLRNNADTLPPLSRHIVRKEMTGRLDSLSASNQKLNKIKEKTREVTPYLTQVNMKRKQPWQNLFFEGTFGLTGTDFKNFSVSPMLGYNLHKNFTIGMGFTYRHSVNDSVRISSTMAYNVVGRFEMARQRFYAQVEHELTLPGISYFNKEFEKDYVIRRSIFSYGLGGTLIEFNRNAIIGQINFTPAPHAGSFQEKLSFKIGFKKK